MTRINNILITIDVEDWFQVENLRPWFPFTKWGNQIQRVEYNTNSLLDLFDKFSRPVKATFFILGWIAERLPNLVSNIQNRGHEIASHGYHHVLNNQMKDEHLRKDILSSKKLLEDLSGKIIAGYRAPSFSINNKILQVIKESGYKYDSSYNSFEMHGRYGVISTNGYKRKGIAIQFDQEFHELPISNLQILNQTIPWGGGGYFRFFPPAVFIKGVRRILNSSGTYLFYMHPWEIDAKQPKVDCPRSLSIWRHYLNLNKTHKRLEKMIAYFQNCNFLTCSQYLDLLNR